MTEKFQVIVRDVKSHTFDVTSEMGIGELLYEIYDRLDYRGPFSSEYGISPAYLIYTGRILKESKTLGDYNIPHDSTLHLIWRGWKNEPKYHHFYDHLK